MTDIERATALLGEHSCVAVCGDVQYVSDLRGVAPLVGWIDADVELTGFSAADRVVGKAAAMLFVLLGADEVYGRIMSRRAAAVFERYGIKYSFGEMVEVIVNREGTGFCPMETATENCDAPDAALDEIRKKMAQLKGETK